MFWSSLVANTFSFHSNIAGSILLVAILYDTVCVVLMHSNSLCVCHYQTQWCTDWLAIGIGWLVGWRIDWLVDRLVNQLAAESICPRTNSFPTEFAWVCWLMVGWFETMVGWLMCLLWKLFHIISHSESLHNLERWRIGHGARHFIMVRVTKFLKLRRARFHGVFHQFSGCFRIFGHQGRVHPQDPLARLGDRLEAR